MTTLRAACSARTYTIGTLAELFGVSRRTLRFYEERELLRPRRDGTQRIYSEEDRTRLEIIVRAKRLGFSLTTIWDLIERRARRDEPETAQGVCDGLALSLGEIEEQIERLMSERQRVHHAIEELREVATRYGLPDDEPPAPGGNAPASKGGA